jgi:hypothetical protein
VRTTPRCRVSQRTMHKLPKRVCAVGHNLQQCSLTEH